MNAGGGQTQGQCPRSDRRRTLVHHANGVRIAWDVGDLLADHQRYSNKIWKPTPLNQKGEEVRGSGESPNEHFLYCFAAN